MVLAKYLRPVVTNMLGVPKATKICKFTAQGSLYFSTTFFKQESRIDMLIHNVDSLITKTSLDDTIINAHVKELPLLIMVREVLKSKVGRALKVYD